MELTQALVHVEEASPRILSLEGQVRALVESELEIIGKRNIQKAILDEILSEQGVLMDSYEAFRNAPNLLYQRVRTMFQSILKDKLLETNKIKYLGKSQDEVEKSLTRIVKNKFLVLIDLKYPNQRPKSYSAVTAAKNRSKLVNLDELECIDEESMRPHAVQEMLCDNVHGQNEQAGDDISERFFILFKCYEKRL